MTLRAIIGRITAGLAVAALVPAMAMADVIHVPAGGGALRAALDRARDGDTLRLAPGLHAGPVGIDRPLTLMGETGAIIDGGGNGRVVTVSAPGAVVLDLTIRGSGSSLATEDAGIFVTRDAHGARIEGNRILGNLIGVYLKGPSDAVVKGNLIRGLTDMRVNERGNGVQIWRAPGAVVVGNRIEDGRDGIFVTTSKRNAFRANQFRRTRIAIHYMYTNASEVSDNLSVGNHVGYALMFSKKLKVSGNVSIGDRDHGMLLNYANGSEIVANLVRDGGDKCVFIYNSSKNAFSNNRFEGCAIGVHFTAGSERNRFTENAFIANRFQVKYVGTRRLDWSAGGRGNYWSDNPAFDLDGDGLGDAAYRPNDIIDEVLWAYPVAKLLLNSPAVSTLRWAQARFPALHPGGVVDTAPLMVAPRLPEHVERRARHAIAGG